MEEEFREGGKNLNSFLLYVVIGLIFGLAGIGTFWFVGKESREAERALYESNNSGLVALYEELDPSEEMDRELDKILFKIDKGLPSESIVRLTKEIGSVYQNENLGPDALTKDGILKIIADDVNNTVSASDIQAVRTYTIEDLTIVGKPTQADQDAYANKVAELLLNVYYDGFFLELQDFLDGFGQQKTDEAKKGSVLKLARASQAYEKLAEGLAIIPVPADKATSHLEIVNGYRALSSGSKILAQSIADPVLAMAGLQIYMSGYELLLKDL